MIGYRTVHTLLELASGPDVRPAWAETLHQVLPVARDLAATVAAISATVVAWIGLHAWRKQLHGRTEYDLARRLLLAAYKVRDAIRTVRAPFIPVEEMAYAMKETGLGDPEHPLETYHRAVYSLRWREMEDACSQLRVESLEAEVLWKETAREALGELQDCIKKLSIAIQEFLRYSEMRTLSPSQQAIREEYRRTLQRGGGGENADDLSEQLEHAIKTLEDSVRPWLDL